MPSLTYTTDNTPHGGLLNSRVLIGRRIPSGLALTDPGVSRLHAWIDPIAGEEADWIITDAGSKTGTFVNEQQITRHPLHDGDRIRIGKITLTYHDTEVLPGDAKTITLAAPDGVIYGAGILFECACGAPLWVTNDLAGKRGLCRHCRKPVSVPALKRPAEAPPTLRTPTLRTPKSKATSVKSPEAKRLAKCAVCHSRIEASEEVTQCPDCAMSFHSECWQENFGCSSYGCPKVDVLKPREETTGPVASTEAILSQAPGPQPRWDVVVLAASVLGSVIACITFGVVALLVAVTGIFLLLKGKQKQPILLIIAMVISLLGIVAGLGVSDFWYFNGRHLPTVFMHH